jgi:hypothetical protein
MASAPILILAYNRPKMVRDLIQSLAPFEPGHIILAVDGPKPGNSVDDLLVQETQSAVGGITWPAKIETIFRSSNLGLRHSVAAAVSHVTSLYGKAIVLEDDVTVGSDFLDYANAMLERYKDEKDLAHINGYNVVPPNQLRGNVGESRLTRYIESFAWATWDRAWNQYDPDLTWALNSSLQELASHCGGLIPAAKWKINFLDAKSERINTWAYRWLATIWSNSWHVLSPNRNLVSYQGWSEGTHTLRTAKWTELPVSILEFGKRDSFAEPIVHDESADRWIGKQVFRESTIGIAEGIAASVALRVINRNQI